MGLGAPFMPQGNGVSQWAAAMQHMQMGPSLALQHMGAAMGAPAGQQSMPMGQQQMPMSLPMGNTQMQMGQQSMQMGQQMPMAQQQTGGSEPSQPHSRSITPPGA